MQVGRLKIDSWIEAGSLDPLSLYCQYWVSNLATGKCDWMSCSDENSTDLSWRQSRAWRSIWGLGASLLSFLDDHLPRQDTCCLSSAFWFILCQDSWSYTAFLLPDAVTITLSFHSHIYHSSKISLDCAGSALSSWFSACHKKHKLLRNCFTGTFNFLLTDVEAVAPWCHRAACIKIPL